MATPSGIAAQFGFKAETTYGTAVTVDRFLPFRSESIADTYGRNVADDITAGAQALRQSQVTAGNETYAGGVETYLYNRNIGVLLAKLLGSVSTAGVGPYTHTITPGDVTGDSLTVQVGRPDMGGTVRPFTYEGVKVRGVTIGATQGEPMTASWDLVAEDMSTGTALATAAYPSGLTRFRGDDLTVTIGGASVPIYAFEVTITSPLDDTLRPVGQSTISEPLRNDLIVVSGSLELRWTDLTYYNLVANMTWSELVATVDNGTDSMTITSDVRFDQAEQAVAGRGVIRQMLTFEAAGASTDADAITIALVNADSAA